MHTDLLRCSCATIRSCTSNSSQSIATPVCSLPNTTALVSVSDRGTPGLEHETALVGCLQQRPSLRQKLGFESVPDQSTLWRSWRKRFTPALRETIETLAVAILVKADQAGVTVPRKPPSTWPRTVTNQEATDDEQAVLDPPTTSPAK